MVEANARDERDVRIDDIDRIKTSPESHFKHRHIYVAGAEYPKRREYRVLEVGERNAMAGTFHDFESGYDLVVFDLLAIDADALVEAHEVRRKRRSHGATRGEQQLFQEDRRRSLSVGAGHHEVDGRRRIQVGARGDFRHGTEAPDNGFRMFYADAVQPTR